MSFSIDWPQNNKLGYLDEDLTFKSSFLIVEGAFSYKTKEKYRKSFEWDEKLLSVHADYPQ